MTHKRTLTPRAGGVSPLNQSGYRPYPQRCLRRAFTLWEMAAVMVGLQVFLALSVGILWASIRIEQSAAEDFQHTVSQCTLADQFRADVAASASAPKKLDGETAGPTCLILRRPDGQHVIYHWDGAHLKRTARKGAGTSSQLLPLGAEQAAVEFTQAEAGRLITMRLTETHGQGSTLRTDRLDITAALGGDLQ